jgi:hypothetical protein
MRKAAPQDRERLADFHASTLLDPGETTPDERMRAWMLDLMSGDHPTFRPSDFLLVEDTSAGKVVSSMGHISQTWTYEGIPFPFGQPEIVSTDPAYRRRGLVRAQFDEVHRWSAERGELVQGITGIPWYYRQFGYEMTVDLGSYRAGYKTAVPKLKEGETEPYTFRPATTDDIPFFQELYNQVTSRSLVASVRDDAIWRYDLTGRSENSGFNTAHVVILTPEGEPAGALIHSRKINNQALRVYMCEAKPGVPFVSIMPSVLRYLDATGQALAKQQDAEFSIYAFVLSEEHPVYDTIPHRLPRVGEPYAWYIRVPDLVAFMRHIAPALENRLSQSPQAGFTGALKLNFYRTGLQLNFHSGSLSVEPWKSDRVEEGDAAFPDLTFLQILFGFRSIDELTHAFPDCLLNTDAGRALVPILFPRKNSHVWPGG